VFGFVPLVFLGKDEGMPRSYSPVVKDRAIKMVLSHRDEYASVWKAAEAIGPKVGVAAESLRRWVIAEQLKDTPQGVAVEEAKAESKRVKDLERQVRDLEEANRILLEASIFFAGELDPRHSR
jgi:transposase-like protein